MAAETSQTLDRGLRLLSRLAREPRGLTITELARELEVNRTVVYRLVATLELHQLARRDRDGKVVIGVAALELARGVEPPLRDQATPVLRELAEELGATAHLTVAEGGEAVAVAVVEPSWTSFHVAYRMGVRHPLERGAAGRAIIGGRAGDPAFVCTQGELQTGAVGVAAPVLGVPGLAASVGVVVLGDLEPARVGPRVQQAAADVAARLGGWAQPRPPSDPPCAMDR